MKNFNSEEIAEIFRACSMLRFSMVLFFIKEAIENPESDSKNFITIAGGGSIICVLIESGDWENLFKNKDWLNILTTAENVNVLTNDMLREFLTTIYKYFPEETGGYLIPRNF